MSEDVNLTLDHLNGTYKYCFQGHGILKLPDDEITKEQSDIIFDHMSEVLNAGVKFGMTLKKMEKENATKAFTSIYELFETSINMGVRAQSVEFM